MNPDPPPRGRAQRMASLAYANEIRLKRADLKKQIRAAGDRPGRGGELAEPVIADPPEWADTMRVAEVLRAVRTMGRVKVERTMREGQISPSKTLGGLTVRQRQFLIRRLHDIRNP